MKRDKINILYNADLILKDLEKGAGRTGIFFVVYNVLRELAKSEQLNVEAYCSGCNAYLLNDFFKKTKEYSSIKIISFFSKVDIHLSKWEFKRKENKLSNGNKITRFLMKLIIMSLKPISNICSINNAELTKKLEKFDVFFNPLHDPPEVIKKKPHIKNFTIIYDVIPLIFPENYPGIKNKNYWYNKIIDSFNKNDHYFAISQHTKDDFIKYVPKMDPDKITVTHLAASEDFYQCKDENKIKKVKEKYNIPQNSKYIFSLCSLEPRKNHIYAVKNFVEFIKKNNIDDIYFVLGGAEWKHFIKELDTSISDLDKYKNKIIKAGYVDDEDLSPLYSGAFCFIYPSSYEGFGLPPLEAMQCGCPVISSNTTSLPEVVGDAALMIDPTSNEQLIEALEKFYLDDNMRQEYAAKGIERAKMFSWKKTADTMVDKILEVVNCEETIKK